MDVVFRLFCVSFVELCDALCVLSGKTVQLDLNTLHTVPPEGFLRASLYNRQNSRDRVRVRVGRQFCTL